MAPHHMCTCAFVLSGCQARFIKEVKRIAAGISGVDVQHVDQSERHNNPGGDRL